MTLEAATQFGVDLIAPAVILFTVWYGFRPWYTTHIGRAVMVHAIGSAILFVSVVLTQHGFLPEHYPGYQHVTLTIILFWIFGWWYLVYALWLTRDKGDAT